MRLTSIDGNFLHYGQTIILDQREDNFALTLTKVESELTELFYYLKSHRISKYTMKISYKLLQTPPFYKR